jgi:hypothetical protein
VVLPPVMCTSNFSSSFFVGSVSAAWSDEFRLRNAGDRPDEADHLAGDRGTACRAAMRSKGGVSPPTPRWSAWGNSGRLSCRWRRRRIQESLRSPSRLSSHTSGQRYCRSSRCWAGSTRFRSSRHRRPSSICAAEPSACELISFCSMIAWTNDGSETPETLSQAFCVWFKAATPSVGRDAQWSESHYRSPTR